MNLGHKRFRNIYGASLLFPVLGALRNKNFSFALYAFDQPSLAFMVSVILGIKKTIGFKSNLAKAQRFLTETIPFNSGNNTVDIDFDLARYIIGDPLLRPIRTPVYYTEQDRKIVQQKLATLKINKEKPFLIIHTGAKYNHQKWPKERYASLATALEETLNIPIIILKADSKDSLNYNQKVISGLTVKQVVITGLIPAL